MIRANRFDPSGQTAWLWQEVQRRCGAGLEVRCYVYKAAGMRVYDATVCIGRPMRNGRLRKPLASVRALGAAPSEAHDTAIFFALRSILYGDAPLLGRLLDRDNVRVDLEADGAGGYRVRIELGLRRRFLRGVALERPSKVLYARVTFHRPANEGRTAYLRVRGLPRWLNNIVPSLIPKSGTVRLHRLVAALAGLPIAKMHVHHLNGVGWDCRAENLMVLTPQEHRDGYHPNDWQHPARDAESQLEPAAIEFAEVADYLAPSVLAGESRGGHIQYGAGIPAYSLHVAEAIHSGAPLPPPLIDDKGILRKLTQRADRLLHLYEALWVIWYAAWPVTTATIAAELSTSDTAARAILGQLESAGLVAIERRRAGGRIVWHARGTTYPATRAELGVPPSSGHSSTTAERRRASTTTPRAIEPVGERAHASSGSPALSAAPYQGSTQGIPASDARIGPTTRPAEGGKLDAAMERDHRGRVPRRTDRGRGARRRRGAHGPADVHDS